MFGYIEWQLYKPKFYHQNRSSDKYLPDLPYHLLCKAEVWGSHSPEISKDKMHFQYINFHHVSSQYGKTICP